MIVAFLRNDTRTGEVETWFEVMDQDGKTVAVVDTEKRARILAPDAVIDWDEVRYRQRLAGQAW